MKYIAMLIVPGLVLSCAGDPLRARAAMDLHCDESQLEVTPRTDTARSVQGCGQQAVYVRACKPCGADGAATCDCQWEMNMNPQAMR